MMPENKAWSTFAVGWLAEVLGNVLGHNVAAAKNEDMEHIFGMSRIGSSWLIFDTTNYDRDNGVRETYWIFSDRYRAGRYYQNFRLVEEAPSEGGAERREAAREAFGIF